MKDNGHKLILSCLREKDIKIFSKIEEKYLSGKELEGYRWVKEDFDRTGKLPDKAAYLDKFITDPIKYADSPENYFKYAVDEYAEATMLVSVPSLLKSWKKLGHEKVLAEIEKLVRDAALPTLSTKTVLYSDNVEDREEAYNRRESLKGVEYLSMGIADFDKIFHGYGREDLITIGGRAGMGKSWILCLLALKVNKVLMDNPLNDKGEPFGDILFLTNEMSIEEVTERMDCMETKISYPDFLGGSLDKENRKKMVKHWDDLQENPTKIRFIEDCNTLASLQEMISTYRPSIVFIDGSYLLETKMQEGWEKITYITRNLKLMCKQYKVPIVNTTQLKRNAGKATKSSFESQDDFAYSNSYVQDSNIAIRMFQNADMVYNKLIGLDIAKARKADSTTVFSFQCDVVNSNFEVIIDTGATEERKGGDPEGVPHEIMKIPTIK